MVLSSDPLFNQLMDRHFDSDRDPQFLYRGSQEHIIEELKAWVCRRKKNLHRANGIEAPMPKVNKRRHALSRQSTRARVCWRSHEQVRPCHVT